MGATVIRLIQRLISRLPRTRVERGVTLVYRSPHLRRYYQGLVSSLKRRDGVVGAGPGKGLRFNVGESDSRFLLGTFEPAVQELLARYLHPGMVFYDVGANVGFLSVLAARLTGDGGEVHCFEPLPANAEQIRYNAALNHLERIIVHALALGRTDGTSAFRVSERPTFGALSDAPVQVAQQIGVIDVPVRRLDSLFREANLRGPDLIKIDIEGSELDFFAGAEEVLRRFRPVLLIELHGTNDGVRGWLERLSYEASIVGGGPLEGAYWAALAIATPREQKETRDLAVAICSQFDDR
jgi:FkbM family methyltransferase